MEHKSYDVEEQALPMTGEPIVEYGRCSPNTDAVLSTFNGTNSPDALYAKLKAEADEIFGVKKRYTPEEYFEKLKYMVNGYYDNIQGQN